MAASFLSQPVVIHIAELVRDLAFVVHAGGIITFALLVGLAHRIGGPSRAHSIRTYQAFGPGLGISLGLLVLGSLVAHYGTVGAFDWSPARLAGGQTSTLAWATFFLAWVSNIRLEVWTLEPIRKLDPNGTGTASDAAALERASRAVQRHLAAQAMLWITTLLLARSAASG